MCQGYNRTHTECGHVKDFTVINPCEAGTTLDGQCQGPTREVVFTQDIDNPGLCRPCYIVQEEFIFKLYAGEIDELETGMANIHNILRLGQNMDDRSRRQLEAELVHVQEGLNDSLADRAGMLGKFRRSQGVWGDG